MAVTADQRFANESASTESASTALAGAVSSRLGNLAGLAASEVRLAAMSALAMCVTALLAAVSVIVAWGMLLAAVLAYAPMLGVAWPIAALLFAALHALLALLLWHKAVRLSRALGLPELRRAVGGHGRATDRKEAVDRDAVPVADSF